MMHAPFDADTSYGQRASKLQDRIASIDVHVVHAAAPPSRDLQRDELREIYEQTVKNLQPGKFGTLKFGDVMDKGIPVKIPDPDPPFGLRNGQVEALALCNAILRTGGFTRVCSCRTPHLMARLHT